jgi:hypothetical protein
MRMHLSGWARLWIVAALVIWGAGVWHALTQIGIPPLPNPTDEQLCLDAWRASGREPDSVWVTDCPDPSDPRVLEVARQSYQSASSSYWTRLTVFIIPWAVAPFALGLVLLAFRWVLAGFAPRVPWARRK